MILIFFKHRFVRMLNPNRVAVRAYNPHRFSNSSSYYINSFLGVSRLISEQYKILTKWKVADIACWTCADQRTMFFNFNFDKLFCLCEVINTRRMRVNIVLMTMSNLWRSFNQRRLSTLQIQFLGMRILAHFAINWNFEFLGLNQIRKKVEPYVPSK